MKRRVDRPVRIAAIAVCLAVIAGCARPLQPAPLLSAPLLPEGATGRAERGIGFGARDLVVAANPLAVEAGAGILARGGSAIDAAIATQMVLNLVEPQSSGIGGGGFVLHRSGGDGRLRVYDGRETAPAGATPDMLLGSDGRPLRKRDAIEGGLSVGTPGLVAMLERAHREHGRLAWAELFVPAIDLAEQGFSLSPRLAAAIASAAPALCRQPAARVYFLAPGGCAPKPPGTQLVNPAFADTLRAIARDGADALRHGPLAREIVATVRSHPVRPGRLSEADLAGYAPEVRDPVCGHYRGLRICGVPPPSSGGVTLLQVLGILEHFDLAALTPGSAEEVHLVTEAERLAYADRARYLADDAFVPVPVTGLLDRDYLAHRAAMIRPDRALGAPAAGRPPGALALEDDRSEVLPSTTHLSIVDAQGNAVAMTTSIEHGMGSRLMVGGFLLNNQLTDFAFAPDGSDGRALANRVEPGKRPLSTMAPLMVFDANGRLEAVLGSPGGIAIVPFVVKTLVALIDHRRDLRQAVAMPNYGAERSALTWLERGTSLVAQAEALRARGHEVGVFDLNSGIHAIVLNEDDAGPGRFAVRAGAGRWAGAADPRREGSAMGSDTVKAGR